MIRRFKSCPFQIVKRNYARLIKTIDPSLVDSLIAYWVKYVAHNDGVGGSILLQPIVRRSKIFCS